MNHIFSSVLPALCHLLPPRTVLCPLPLLTEQRPGGHIQRGGQVTHYISDLTGQEGQVGEGDDEETHVEEVQQLPV